VSAKRAGRPVFDASAVLALLQGEPGEEKLREAQPQAVVSAVNVAEVLAKLVDHGIPPRQALAAFGALHLETLPFDSAAAENSAAYVAKGTSLGDRCFLAAAHLHGLGWTSDRNLGSLPGVPPLRFFR